MAAKKAPAKSTPKNKPPPEAVEVYLEASHGTQADGSTLWFVMVKGLLSRRVLVLSNAYPIEKATTIKERVEDRLHLYRRPKGRRRKPKAPKVQTAWDRILEDKDSV